jgi:cellulose synthase/poly-beta-1,6-N-acetylglucosamine synthase-like glycosyltransferase
VSPHVEIVVLTRDRPDEARQAVASLWDQWYDGPLRIVVCVDDGAARGMLGAGHGPAAAGERRVVVRPAPAQDVADTSERLARIRNWAVGQCAAELVGFLDDDNVALPDHVGLLVSALDRTGADAAHSARRILGPDGVPWYGDRFPWSAEDDEATVEAWWARRVLHPGSDLLSDRAVLPDGSLGMVDTSCWLLRRELLRRIPFPDRRSAADVAALRTEDDLLLERLVAHGAAIASTTTPTVLYRLGGYSNRHAFPRAAGRPMVSGSG